MKIPVSIGKMDYVITGDIHQFILNRYIEGNVIDPKTGERRVARSYFYPKIERLIQDLFDMGLRTADVDTFRGLRDEAERLRKICEAIAREMRVEI